jgi:transposase InsO family protein
MSPTQTVRRWMSIPRFDGRVYTRRDPDATPADDPGNRAFDPTEPDRLWVMDDTEHPTGDGKLYLAVVLDTISRRVVGWSIADHIRAELVVDTLHMATWRRQPPKGQTVAHSDHGSQAARSECRMHPATSSRRPTALSSAATASWAFIRSLIE